MGSTNRALNFWMFTPIADLKAANLLACDNEIALSNVTASAINLLAIRVARAEQPRALHLNTFPNRWMRTVVGSGSKSA